MDDIQNLINKFNPILKQVFNENTLYNWREFIKLAEQTSGSQNSIELTFKASFKDLNENLSTLDDFKNFLIEKQQQISGNDSLNVMWKLTIKHSNQMSDHRMRVIVVGDYI